MNATERLRLPHATEIAVGRKDFLFLAQKTIGHRYKDGTKYVKHSRVVIIRRQDTICKHMMCAILVMVHWYIVCNMRQEHAAMLREGYLRDTKAKQLARTYKIRQIQIATPAQERLIERLVENVQASLMTCEEAMIYFRLEM